MTTNSQIVAGIEIMKNQHLEKNFQLRWVEHFLFCSLTLLMIQDASSTTDVKCEIKSSCPSSECQHTDPMAVDPDSNITRNCSIITGQLELGMTWRQAKKKIQDVTGSSDLVLVQSNSTKDNDTKSCYCSNVHFTCALNVLTSSTPSYITEGRKPEDLECFFSGWPLPLQVHWYKDDKIITNGTEGIYHSEEKRGKNGEETLRSRLSLPPGHEEQEGVYKCRAKNSISGWQSEVSEELQLIFVCPNPKGPTIDHAPEVLAETFSTVILTCSSVTSGSCPTQLIWHNDTAPLVRGTKYQIEEKSSKCKLQSILSIFNVTEDDEGNYSCTWNCNNRVAAINLKVFVQSQTAQAAESVTTSTRPSPNLGSSGGRREGLLPIIIISAASVTVLSLF